MRRVPPFERGNIIASGAQHNGMTMPNSNEFHLALSPKRQIESFEELVLWEHLKGSDTTA